MPSDSVRKEEKKAAHKAAKKESKGPRGAESSAFSNPQRLALLGAVALVLVVAIQLASRAVKKIPGTSSDTTTPAPKSKGPKRYLAAISASDADCKTQPGLVGYLCQQGATLPVKIADFPLEDVDAMLAESKGEQARWLQGLAATKDLKKGDRVLEVPRKFAFTDETVQQRVLDACQDSCEAQTLLVLGLAYEVKHPRPEFTSWIASLPTAATNIAGFQPEALEVARMRAPQGVKLMEDRIDDAVNLAGNLGLDEASLKWAYGIVQARGIGVIVDGKSKSMLMQGFDLFNHAVDGEFEVLQPECDAKSCWNTLHRPVEKGQQIMGFYGEHNNFDLLLRWGFTSPANPYGPSMPSLNISLIKDNLAWLPQVGCSQETALNGPTVKKGINKRMPDFAGVPPDDMALRCHFVALAFDSLESTKVGFQKGAERCLHSAKECKDQKFRHAAHLTHKAAQRACVRVAKFWKDEKAQQAMAKMSTQDDEISYQLMNAIGEEVRMLSSCMAHHGEQASNLLDAPKVNTKEL